MCRLINYTSLLIGNYFSRIDNYLSRRYLRENSSASTDSARYDELLPASKILVRISLSLYDSHFVYYTRETLILTPFNYDQLLHFIISDVNSIHVITKRRL